MESRLFWLSKRILYLLTFALLVMAVWAWFYKVPVSYQSRSKVVTSNGLKGFELLADAEKIGGIKPGMKVFIKMDIFPYQETGSIVGKVFEVGKFPVKETPRGIPLYLVKVKPTYLPGPINGRLEEGLQGTAEIVTGEYRLINKILTKN